MKKYWWILIIIGLALIFAFYEKEEKSKLSKIQEEVENQVGEGLVTFLDLNTKLTTTVDFENKKGQEKYGENDANIVNYFITNILQTFNIENITQEEFQF